MTKEYERYLRSPEWKKKRAERLEIDGYRCVMCQRPIDKMRKPIQCHHITYKHAFDPDVMTELVSLCPGCHVKLHRYLQRRTK